MLDAAVYHGPEGLREYLSLLQEMWKSVRFEAQEYISVGEDQVILVLVGHATFRVVCLSTAVGGSATCQRKISDSCEPLAVRQLFASQHPVQAV